MHDILFLHCVLQRERSSTRMSRYLKVKVSVIEHVVMPIATHICNLKIIINVGFLQEKQLCQFENVFVLSTGGVFEINLDKRKLKTPGGKLFTVPNEALAIAVATEWDVQKDTLKFYTMHLVGYYYKNVKIEFLNCVC